MNEMDEAKSQEIYEKIKKITMEQVLKFVSDSTKPQSMPTDEEFEKDGLKFMNFLLETTEVLDKVCTKAVEFKCTPIHHILMSLMLSILNPEELHNYSRAFQIVQRKKVEMGHPGVTEKTGEALRDKLINILKGAGINDILH